MPCVAENSTSSSEVSNEAVSIPPTRATSALFSLLTRTSLSGRDLDPVSLSLIHESDRRLILFLCQDTVKNAPDQEVFRRDRNRRGTFLDPPFALRSISPACLMKGTPELTPGFPCCEFYKPLFGIVAHCWEVGQLQKQISISENLTRTKGTGTSSSLNRDSISCAQRSMAEMGDSLSLILVLVAVESTEFWIRKGLEVKGNWKS